MPECATYRDCADGQACASGACLEVQSKPGDACDREPDCGPGQSCRVGEVDFNSDGAPDFLAATCQLDEGGALPPGAACRADGECRSSACALGRCAEVCVDADDCTPGHACTAMPRSLGEARAGVYGACVPSVGVITVPLAVDPATGAFTASVPPHALSLTLTADVGEPWLDVAFTKLISPGGDVLVDSPFERADLPEPKVRYAPASETSSLLLPSSTAAPLEPGIYEGRVAAWHHNERVPAGVVPRVTATVRVGLEGRSLDVAMHFVDLDSHPCLTGPALSAASAPDHPAIEQGLLPAWRSAFAPAGVLLGRIEFHDLVGHPGLASIEPDEVGTLFALGEGRGQMLDVFVVRSLHPLGVLAAVGGRPGPLDHGTTHSGIIVSADALCLVGAEDWGVIAARAAAGYLGLEESESVEGRGDLLVSTGNADDNLMYFRLGQAAELTTEQRAILRRSPVLR